IRTLLERALTDERGLGGAVEIEPDALEQLVRLAGGDARRSLTILEAAAGAALATASPTAAPAESPTINVATVAQAADSAAVRYDKDGDQHYDVISAFIKSIRGSDPDAALHYLARMIVAGEDPRFIARRLIVHAAEDIGMADPSALQTATAAAQAAQFIGLPEARIPLAEAVIHLATAPKSNAVIAGIDQAIADVQAGKIGAVPAHLRDAHYANAKTLGHGVGYLYPHNFPNALVAQQYLPDELVGTQYYHPTDHGYERQVTERLAKIKAHQQDL
ncbi:MAG: replication-associated recombination protein A, partial [Cellulomonadaceae bacterium]|nr:replication-associated recombination protein A [Cellulomonadaceae bacterium]